MSMTSAQLTQRYEEELEGARQKPGRKHGNVLLGTVPKAAAVEFFNQPSRKQPVALVPTSNDELDVILCGDKSSAHESLAYRFNTRALSTLPPLLKEKYFDTVFAGAHIPQRPRARIAGPLCAGTHVKAGTSVTKEPDLRIWSVKTGGERTAIEVSCLREKPSELLFSAMLWSQEAPQGCTQPIGHAYNTIALDVNTASENIDSSCWDIAIALLALPAAQEGGDTPQGTLTLMNASAHFASTWKRAIEASGLQVMIIHNATSVSLPVNFIYRALPRCTQTVEFSLEDFAEVMDDCLKRDRVEAENKAWSPSKKA